MPRPRCLARVRGLPTDRVFKPRGKPMGQLAVLTLAVEELEALKLADLMSLYHAEAAARMGVSRATFGRLLAAARRKTASALVLGKALAIQGGHYREEEGGSTMRKIAVATDEAGNISQHFGRSAAITVFDVTDDGITARADRPLPDRRHGGHGAGSCGGHGQHHGEGHGRGHGGRGHGWIESLVADCGAIVVGGIGAGARDALDASGLRVLLAERGETPDAAALRAAASGGDAGPEPDCPQGR